MNNISQISKAKRLTEEEVHAAAEELQLNGGKVCSIEVYRLLGRGSLTTITNFLKTWHQEEKATTLPALIMLPEALKKSAEQLIVKVWSESQTLAEQELKSQQEALRQAEALANEKIAEAEAFSEEQAAQIEELEAKIEKIIIEMDKQHKELIKGIEIEQEYRQKAVVKEAVTASKLIEVEKRFDYVNAALIEQQQANQALAAENIALKTKFEAEEADQRHSKLLTKDIEILREKASKKENEVKFLKDDIYQEKQRVEGLSEENKRVHKDNKDLIEKAAKLEGELIAWKEIKPEAKKEDAGKKEFKQTEWPEEKTSR
ncbi:MAG: DNA-binding protein [Methylobacter sp.]